jgi:hypothetical protein
MRKGGGGTNDRAERDPGLAVGGFGEARSRVLVLACAWLAGLAACEVLEEIEAAEAGPRVYKKPKPFEGLTRKPVCAECAPGEASEGEGAWRAPPRKWAWSLGGV